MRSRKVNVKVALKVLPILLLNIRFFLVTVLNFIVDVIIIAILFIAILFLIRLDPLAAMFEQLLVPLVILLMMMIIAPHKVMPVKETRSTHTRSSAGCHTCCVVYGASMGILSLPGIARLTPQRPPT